MLSNPWEAGLVLKRNDLVCLYDKMASEPKMEAGWFFRKTSLSFFLSFRRLSSVSFSTPVVVLNNQGRDPTVSNDSYTENLTNPSRTSLLSSPEKGLSGNQKHPWAPVQLAPKGRGRAIV